MHLYKVFISCIILMLIWVALPAQDSISVAVQSAGLNLVTDGDSIAVQEPVFEVNALLLENTLLNLNSKPEPLPILPRNTSSNHTVFYVLAFLCLIFGLAKFFNPKYFSTVFRVFFNSTLRQSQLTDQLVQAKLPSLFYNCFFFVTAGFYSYLVVRYFQYDNIGMDWKMIQICILTIAILYLGKYIVLRFVGWLTGYNKEAEIYIFVTYLINKIIGICLLPFLIILSFSDSNLATVAIVISLSIIVILIIMRYFRSFALLQHRLHMGIFHFFLYIFSLEILPLLLIYKASTAFLGINL